jgi:hypothetical protein
MISYNELIASVKQFDKFESEEYEIYSKTINELRKQYSIIKRKSFNPKFNKQNRRFQNNTQRKDNGLKTLIANSDKMINNFTNAINKLNESNYKIIYNDVVQLFTNYIGEFITDYVESYVKFGIGNKCEIEDLNLLFIKDKYNHYQIELWKILIDKFMNSKNYIIYNKFINNLINWNTDIFNETIIDNIKKIFKTYCGHKYDIIKLDGINEEDPEQFFQPAIVELSERDTAIYNKITEILDIFEGYDFSFTNISNSNKKFLESINLYSLDVSVLSEKENIYYKMITKYIRKEELGERLGLLLYYYNVSNNSLDKLNKFIDYSLTLEDKSKNISVISYMIMEILNNEERKEKILQVINRDELTDKLNKLSAKLPTLIKYKMMDVLDLY